MNNTKQLTFGSLFAGIGGFDLGFERAGMRCKWQVEIAEFSQTVLAKHWPDVGFWDDVRTFPDCSADWNVDLICGGFPCQDISNAGHREGIDGERSGLWTHFARVIRAIRPRYVVVENVAALLVRGIDRVLGDLASVGLDAEWSVFPTCALGAPHTRERLFIVAYAASRGRTGTQDSIFGIGPENDEAAMPLETVTLGGRACVEGREWWNRQPEIPAVDDGLSARLADGPNRAIGNSVSPIVTEWIGRRIVKFDGARNQQSLGATMIEELPKSLLEAVRYFSDLDKCDELMKEVKWPNGKIVCPKCGGESVSPVKGRRKMQCNSRACKRQFSFKVGTIFEDSPLGLDKWFVALWSVANCKNGISSHELGRALGVTQATAWFMCHRIRKAMEVGSFAKLAGEVESDETFIGGKAANMHKAVRERKIQGRGSVGKTPVQGLVERGGRIKTFVIPGATADVLQGNVLMNVEKGSHLYTDEATAYIGLLTQYVHQTVNHGTGEYVRGRTHTNTLECFWSLLNRALKGTYTHCEPFHLHRYTTEEAFRFNEREVNDAMRFLLVLRGVVGKRLTYRRLAAIGDSGFMGLK